MNNLANEITKYKVLSSLIWKLMERVGTQGIQFIVTIVLARILLPEDFGLIVLVTVFISIASVFVQSGFNTALIQKKDIDEIDLSSIFYLCLFMAFLLYVILFFSAPLIANYFEQPEFELVIRCLSLNLFFGAINTIQIAIISRNMQFKNLFVSSLGAILISGILGIYMAYASFGVWALVVQQLLNQCVVTFILWFKVKWRPRLIFSVQRVRILFSYGWKILASGLLDTLDSRLQSLIVGAVFSPTMLGFYNRGEQFPNLIVSNVDGSIQSVMFPTLSSHQDNNQRLKEIVRRAIVTSSFIIFPLMVGLAAIAEPLIKLLLTEKWLPAVPFLQIFCATYALWPIHSANLQVINAKGRSDLFLKLEIFKKILVLSILAITIQFGIYAMVWGGFISSVISTFINAFPNRKLINYSLHEQWLDIIPSLLLSLIMGITVYMITLLELTTIITLTTQICIGIVVYIGLAKIFKLDCYVYLTSTMKEMLGKKYMSIKSNV